MRTQNPLVATPCGFKSHRRHHVGMDCAPFKKPSRKAGLFSYRSVIPPFPHKTLLCKLSWGPRPTGQGGEQASISSRKRTSEWTALHSKSPAERLGFSHTAPSFLLLPAKLCFANFRRGPGRPAGRQSCKLCIACGDFFVKVTGALILLLLASPPCRATTHCAPFKKPSRLAGLSLLFSFRSGTSLAARAFPGENAHGSTALLAHLCRHSQLRGVTFV